MIAGRWGQRRDWLTDIDAVCRALENDDAVRLVSLQGELGMETGAAEIFVSGLASDSSSMPRLLTRCAEDTANVDVFPLGLRPQRSQGLEGVQFELRVSRQAASENRDGS